MKAVIPVAGLGTRLRPHTLTKPKVLLPIAGKPMVAHIVEKLIDDGVTELVFVVGHLRQEIEKYIRGTYSLPSHFVWQKETLGLGHAIYVTRGVVADDEPMVIVLGDTLYDVDLKPVLKSNVTRLGVKKVEDPRRFGVAVVDEQGFVKQVVEKPHEPISNLALVGLYFVKNSGTLFEALQELIDRDIRTKNEYQLTDGFQLMIDRGEKITVFEVQGWYDCGKQDAVLETNQIMLEKLYRQAKYEYPNSVIIPPVFIHPTAEIAESVIGPHVSIGAHSKIQEAVIRNSIIGEHTEVRRKVVSDSLIGDHVHLLGKYSSENLGDYSQSHE